MTAPIPAGSAYRAHPTSIGVLTLIASPAGLSHVCFEGDPAAEDADLPANATGATRQILDAAAEQLDAYLAGSLDRFDLHLNHTTTGPVQAAAQRALELIPYGQTASYRELAELAGRPQAVRAAGTACATNPLPLILPCHRVVHSGGDIGRYGGGLDVKRTLLDLERKEHE